MGLLQEVVKKISEHQHNINKFSTRGYWRMANVTPIFKMGSKQSAGNYRPVRLGKIKESILRDSFMAHLEKYNLIKNSQLGFTIKSSGVTNIRRVLEAVTYYIDKGYPVDALYLDFKKVFDKVSHCRLLSKLKARSIYGRVASA